MTGVTTSDITLAFQFPWFDKQTKCAMIFPETTIRRINDYDGREMNVIDFGPLAGTIGGGFIAGELLGYASRKALQCNDLMIFQSIYFESVQTGC